MLKNLMGKKWKKNIYFVMEHMSFKYLFLWRQQ